VVGLPRGFSATESGLPRRTGTIPERFSEVAKNVRVSVPLDGLLYFRKFGKEKKRGGDINYPRIVVRPPIVENQRSTRVSAVEAVCHLRLSLHQLR
jgi:hypothetical protein